MEIIAATRRFRNFDFCFLIFDFAMGHSAILIFAL